MGEESERQQKTAELQAGRVSPTHHIIAAKFGLERGVAIDLAAALLVVRLVDTMRLSFGLRPSSLQAASRRPTHSCGSRDLLRQAGKSEMCRADSAPT
jgi:hypothetical protein